MSGFGSWTSWASTGLPSYVIPESGTVLVHVNATDLHNGTAKVGGAWTQNGTVPFTAGTSTTPASVGAFTTNANWFSQSPSALDLTTGPWTVVIVCSAPSANTNLLIQSGVTSVSGWYIQVTTGALGFINGNTNNPYVTTGSTFSYGSPHVLMCGIDGSGTAWGKIDNGTAVSAASSTVTAGATIAGIGAGATAGAFAWNGTVYELMASTAVPSSAAFTAIYNGILANWPGA